MSKRDNDIPIYTLPPGAGGGIMVMRQSFDGSPGSQQIERPHRDSGYTFILQEKGVTHIEIDFQIYQLQSPAVIFIRPGQVHRVIAFEDAEISTWMITAENLRPDYLHLLNNLVLQNELSLAQESMNILSATARVCMKVFELKDQKLYHAFLQDGCNTLVGLVASQFAAQANPTGNYTRFELVTNAFRKSLEQNFKTIKRPAMYAELLNVSVSYLNECVHKTSGRPVSDLIRERVVLEAKRLLYHSAKSVKEIAGELGYDDYSYFTRLFVKAVGVTPLTFRDKNRD
ncbi:AraC family transcriptional regulator [Mucilaginibacter agri]|uniref:Helix-turn-helix domain-containing protein n=1 Tax=Mucilaginibacter agri TaxID=2695265 RepID=A0A965ZIF5_9SPHI|nr:helix-turn-helix transcriptional regulator [Mucilaginibacter agri]NCD71640.1 helix-turn-helix domain-containing protein [Mucilaginibacter agri]